MMFLKEHYRDFEKTSFIFKNETPAEAEIKTPDIKNIIGKMESELTREDLKKMKTMPAENMLDEMKQKLAAFNPDSFADAIKKEFGDKADESQIARAKKAYETVYNAELAKFWKRTEQRISDLEDAQDEIISGAKKQLKFLRADVQRKQEAASAIPEIKDAVPAGKGKSLVYEIPVTGAILRNYDIPLLSRLLDPKEYRAYKDFQYENTRQFRAFADAMANKYLDSEQYKAQLPKENKSEYSKLAGRFSSGMEDYVKAQLEYIYKNSGDAESLKSSLENLRNIIVNSYEQYDSNKDGTLGIDELRSLDNSTKQFADLSRLINVSTNEEALLKNLEGMNFFGRENLKIAVSIISKQIIDDAARNGSEEKFIATVKKITGERADMDFYQASARFESYMDKHAETGVREAINAAKAFNKELNEERTNILSLSDINPPNIRELVWRQRELIIARRVITQSPDDIKVAEFMSTTLVCRMQILNDPVRRQALFQSIQNIKQYYPKAYRDRLGNSNRKQFKTRISHPEAPTADEEMARIPAMMTLAKEAELIIKNLNGNGALSKELENTSADKVAPMINTKFRSVDKMHRVRFVSKAEAGGFNGRDIALGAVKIWAGLTLFLNFMNARKQMEGHGLEPWVKGMGAMATNPYFLTGAGAIYGIDKFQKNPAYANYLSMDAGGQERLGTHDALTSLAKKNGRQAVLAFISSPGEFGAIDSVTENGVGTGKVTNILKQASDRAAREKKADPKLKDNEVITKEDLKSIVDVKYWSQIPEGNDRMRYLFYKSLLTQKRNIRQLKDNCESWN